MYQCRSTIFQGILICVIFRPRDMQEYIFMFIMEKLSAISIFHYEVQTIRKGHSLVLRYGQNSCTQLALMTGRK
jgi:hypothetical protein